MGRKTFTETEIKTLLRNPYVSNVNENNISYSTEFKFLFIQEYINGKQPTQIFRDAGFDVKILGSKRIERACARWKESYQNGTLGEHSAALGRNSLAKSNAAPSEKTQSAKKHPVTRYHRQEETIKKLRAEILLLRRIRECEREKPEQYLSRTEICRIIESIVQQEEYRRCISHLCKAAGISRNTYYEYRKSSGKCDV